MTGGADGVVEVLVHRFDPDLPLPAYARPGDAGADLVTAVDVTLAPGERALLPTGVGIALPA
ncbi:MAG TPA: dUTP diphosphatase, partial [Frankiaceae bacterium]|nr:dUTP diphosphatase [Frankiaceae bacterium]